VTKKKSKNALGRQNAPGKLPTVELARFLRRLSFLYRDPVVGNEPLSTALAELASNLVNRPDNFLHGKPSTEARKKMLLSKQHGHFSELDAQRIEQLLQTSSITKIDLMQLAGERFSIPRAKLTKLTLEGVREAIRTALRNEESLKIISREALRGGSARSS
jgi:hypothetical protein